MYEVTPYNTAITPADELRPALFNDFIKYVDRSERTAATYITDLRQFAAWLAFKAIRRPERPDVIAYRDYLGREHEAIQYDRAAGWRYRTDRNGKRYTITCKPATVRQYLRAVRAFFSWTSTEGYYPDIARGVHAPKVRHDVHKKDALKAADVLAIEKSIESAAGARVEAAAGAAKDTAGRISRATEQGKRLFAIYVLAVNAGLRTIEISRANVRDLEYKNGAAVLYVWGKGHTEPDARKPLAPGVYEAIRDYLDSRSDRPTPNSPLFVATGNRSGGRRIAPATISKQLKKAMQAAGYNSDRITAHSLRHTAGSNAMLLTGDLFTVQQYMRHASPVTTEIYIHVETEELEAQTARDLYDLYHAPERRQEHGRAMVSI